MGCVRGRVRTPENRTNSQEAERVGEARACFVPQQGRTNIARNAGTQNQLALFHPRTCNLPACAHAHSLPQPTRFFSFLPFLHAEGAPPAHPPVWVSNFAQALGRTPRPRVSSEGVAVSAPRTSPSARKRAPWSRGLQVRSVLPSQRPLPPRPITFLVATLSPGVVTDDHTHRRRHPRHRCARGRNPPFPLAAQPSSRGKRKGAAPRLGPPRLLQQPRLLLHPGLA
ncbi:hypothetical protein CALVIDRAFT_83430 [Calocera viscosa TUFC12733]|uniref:Uncharacterized protein n=1 Tax=Calocera viscosa (strain TUFC12733) TaxID=1330018 RepID=A0A167N3W7_CALVF|nr:hypothetical protein CALVIDRAFT_83430 [Calocera viscosa TUFC12733]